MQSDKYVIIFEDGRSVNLTDTSYHNILETIWLSYVQGSYNGNYPNMLLKNGKIIVLSGLHDIAYRYGNFKRDRTEEIEYMVTSAFPEPDTVDTGDFK